jgi:hypothetical protein
MMRRYSLALNTLAQLGGHPRIKLDGGTVFTFLQDPHREVTRSRSDFEHHVRGLEVRLVDNSLCYPVIQRRG